MKVVNPASTSVRTDVPWASRPNRRCSSMGIYPSGRCGSFNCDGFLEPEAGDAIDLLQRRGVLGRRIITQTLPHRGQYRIRRVSPNGENERHGEARRVQLVEA